MAKKIKLTCASCGGEVIYIHEKPSDQDGAHARLHSESCAYKLAFRSISYIAEHGQPVESEVLTEEPAPSEVLS